MRVFAYDLNHNFDLSGNCVLRFKCPVPDYAEEALFRIPDSRALARPSLSVTVSPCRARVSDSAAGRACARSPRSPRPYRISQSIRLPLSRSKRSLLHAEALRSTGIAPLPRYYGLIRLLLSLALLAVLPSSLAGLSKHAAPFAPPRPRSPNRFGREVLTSHIETCWSRGIKLTRLYVGSSLALRLTSSSDRTPAHRSPFARPVLLIVCRFLYDLAPFS